MTVLAIAVLVAMALLPLAASAQELPPGWGELPAEPAPAPAPAPVVEPEPAPEAPPGWVEVEDSEDVAEAPVEEPAAEEASAEDASEEAASDADTEEAAGDGEATSLLAVARAAVDGWLARLLPEGRVTPPKLSVKKIADPPTPPNVKYDFTSTQSPTAFQLYHDQPWQTFTASNWTEITVEENYDNATHLSVDCVVVDGGGSVQSSFEYIDGGVTVTLIDSDVECVFTNTPAPPKLIVVKDALPADGTDFEFWVNVGTDVPLPVDVAKTNGVGHHFVLDDDGGSDGTYSDMWMMPLEPGWYNVSEGVPPGWQFGGISCDLPTEPPTNSLVAPNGNPKYSVNVYLDYGDVVTCTFTNLRFPHLTVVKDANPADGTDFKFSVSAYESEQCEGSVCEAAVRNAQEGYEFYLDDADPDDGDDVESSWWQQVPPGAYLVEEYLPKGWTLDDITCTGANGAAYDLDKKTATVDLAWGDDAICTFTNKMVGTITVIKQTIPDASTGSFTFTGDVAGTIGDGGSLSGEFVPGTYSVSEAVPAGWSLDDIACTSSIEPSDGNGEGESGEVQINGTSHDSSTFSYTTDGADIDLVANDDVECTFTNRRVSVDLSITKTGPAAAVVGTNAAFTVTVTNNGASQADGVTVTDTLPADLTFVSTAGCANDPNGVPICQLGSIAAGASKAYTVTATVTAAGKHTNTAVVSTTSSDTNSANNTATASVLGELAKGSQVGAFRLLGVVFNDLNGNGVQDAGEPGIPNVLVNVLQTGNAPATSGLDEAAVGDRLAQATNASGLVQFSGLSSGVYQVSVDVSTLPANLVATTPAVATVTLSSAAVVPTATFGFASTQVLGATITAGESLPRTGADAQTTLLVGAALLTMGAVLVAGAGAGLRVLGRREDEEPAAS